MHQSPQRMPDVGPNSSSAAEWAALLAAAQNGDLEAQGRLLESCRGYLLSVAAGNLDGALTGKVGASDLVQDTFTAAHQHFDHFRGGNEQELLAWLCKILNNKVFTTQRRFLLASKRDVRRERPLDLGKSSVIGGPLIVSDSSSPSQKAIASEESQRLSAMLEQLPDEYRRAILLRNWERRSFDEMGLLLGKTPNGARKLWLRALAQLEDLMTAGVSDSNLP